jgi:hypothetical protein
VQYNITNNATFGIVDFQGSSSIHTYMGGNVSADHLASGAVTDTLAYGNGVLEITGMGGGGTNYLICGIDSVSVQAITGYSSVGADSLKQLAADLAIAFTEGHTYRLTFNVTNCTAGTCTPSIGGTSGTAISADGSYSMDIICGTGEDFELAASSDFAGSFDNIAIVEVTDTVAYTSGGYGIFLDMWMPFKTIGSSEVDNAINLPGEYLLALKWELASELLPEYGRNALGYIPMRAKMYTDVLRRINTRQPKPTTLWPVLPVLDRQLAVNTG